MQNGRSNCNLPCKTAYLCLNSSSLSQTCYAQLVCMSAVSPSSSQLYSSQPIVIWHEHCILTMWHAGCSCCNKQKVAWWMFTMCLYCKPGNKEACNVKRLLSCRHVLQPCQKVPDNDDVRWELTAESAIYQTDVCCVKGHAEPLRPVQQFSKDWTGRNLPDDIK